MSYQPSPTVTLNEDNTIVDESNTAVPIGTVINCIGSFFKVTENGVSHHIGGNTIKPETRFMNGKYYRILHELALRNLQSADDDEEYLDT